MSDERSRDGLAAAPKGQGDGRETPRMDEGDGLPRQAVALQPLTTADVGRLTELDRSESVGMLYAVRDGEIVPTGEGREVPQWSGAWLDETVAFVCRHLESGGAGTAAFAGGGLVGIVVLGSEPVRGDPHELQLAFLHVARLYRRRGVAGRLFAEARAEAVRRGARSLYISAMPSESALGFYLAQGAALADPPDPHLLALEPEDVHLVLVLDA